MTLSGLPTLSSHRRLKEHEGDNVDGEAREILIHNILFQYFYNIVIVRLAIRITM